MSDKQVHIDPVIEEYWRQFLLYGNSPLEKRFRTVFGRLPADPRCKLCYAPFKGAGSLVMKAVFNKRPSQINPKMCNFCEENLIQHLGGAEVELTMLFADIRGSTSLAEHMSIAEFRELIDRFYQVSAKALIDSDAFLDKLMGDEVSGGYVPGFAGRQHAMRAIEAAQEILQATGHADAGGPWAPVGVGVHTGVAYVGAVGSRDGVVDFTALGDAPNTAARLASHAAAGEILVSEEAWKAAGLDIEGAEQRRLQVKGRSRPVDVHVLGVTAKSQVLAG